MRAMDRFVPREHDLHSMSEVRHLRSVPSSPEGAAYVVARSAHARPGMPFVIAKCVTRGVASVFALAGQDIRTHEQMQRDSALAEALVAWEAGDDTLAQMERRARAAFGRQTRRELVNEPRWHPSRTGITLA